MAAKFGIALFQLPCSLTFCPHAQDHRADDIDGGGQRLDSNIGKDDVAHLAEKDIADAFERQVEPDGLKGHRVRLGLHAGD